jgi:molybdenum cofactor synthesis domain-containing protein
MKDKANKTVALVIIGNEIINGEIQDTNGIFISNFLTDIGYKVSGINIINDDIDYAFKILKFLSNGNSIVVTVGGLGPTVDDITMAAVAKVFSMKLITKSTKYSTEYKVMSGSETKNNQIKNLPEEAFIIRTPNGPIVNTRNIYSLPGLPSLVRERLPFLKNILYKPFQKVYKKEWVIELPQSSIASLLDEGTVLFPHIAVGCYPQKEKSNRTKITLSGTNKIELEKFYHHIMNSF